MCVWLSVCIVKVGNTGFRRWSDVSAVCLHLQNCQSGILMEALPVKPKEATPMCTFTPWPCTGTPSGWATTSWCCARPTSTINCPPTPTVVNPVTRLWRGTSKWFFKKFFFWKDFLVCYQKCWTLGKKSLPFYWWIRQFFKMGNKLTFKCSEEKKSQDSKSSIRKGKTFPLTICFHISTQS